MAKDRFVEVYSQGLTNVEKGGVEEDVVALGGGLEEQNVGQGHVAGLTALWRSTPRGSPTWRKSLWIPRPA